MNSKSDMVLVIKIHVTFTEEKESVFGVILVGILPAFPRIQTEYGEILRIFPYSVRMLENVGKMQARIPPNTDSLYAVFDNHDCQLRITN